MLPRIPRAVGVGSVKIAGAAASTGGGRTQNEVPASMARRFDDKNASTGFQDKP